VDHKKTSTVCLVAQAHQQFSSGCDDMM